MDRMAEGMEEAEDMEATWEDERVHSIMAVMAVMEEEELHIAAMEEAEGIMAEAEGRVVGREKNENIRPKAAC